MAFPHWLYAAYRHITDALGPIPLRLKHDPLAGKTLAVRPSFKRSAYATGDYEATTANALCALARPDMVAFDVGAHFGYFTLLLAERVAHVHAFEPAPANFRALVHTLQHNRVNNATAHPVAISARSGPAVLEVTPASSMYRLQGNARILKEGPVHAVGTLRVQAVSLDNFVETAGITRVDLVKLDVEGEELRALLGMQTAVRRWQPAIVLEVHTQLAGGEDPHQVLRLLHRWGYTCRDLGAGGAVITRFAHTWSEHHVVAEG